MQILFDLIHSLAKEEKRLYQLHKRENRFQRIYEGYAKTQVYSKTLDQNLYAEHFQDVSRAFYSMQKRALLDDILVVLLEYSNSQNPGYQFIRLYGRAQVLLQRRMGDAAAMLSQEALESAQASGNSEQLQLALKTQQEALLLTKEPSLKQYEDLQARIDEVRQASDPESRLKRVRESLGLLRLNYDDLPEDTVQQRAAEFMGQLKDLAIDEHNLPLTLEKLATEQLYYQIMDQPDEYHRRLAQYHKRLTSNGAILPEDRYFELVNMYLRSGLRSGDFLLLTGMIYKLNKEVDMLKPEIRQAFLPAYLETCALFNFYENDLPQGLKQVDTVIRTGEPTDDQQTRCIFYRLAMLIAAHLPSQAREEIAYYSQQAPELAENPLMALMEVMAAIDAKQDPDETLFMIERHKNHLKKRKDSKAVIEALGMLAGYVEKKRVKERPIRVFPPDWENILRVDLYVRAKQSTSFYYNLMLEDWKARKKVF